MAIKIFRTKPEFVDERGYITRVVNVGKHPLKAILYITSKDGSIRGNHYHKKDIHFVFCVKGKFRYYEKNINNKNSSVESVILTPGDLVLSKSGVAHAMKFLEDSVFMAFTTEERDQDKYENDTVRIKIV